jgi:hypothetical protein
MPKPFAQLPRIHIASVGVRRGAVCIDIQQNAKRLPMGRP